VHDGEVGSVDHAEGERAFHVERVAVDLGRDVASVRQRGGAVPCDARGDGGGLRGAEAEQTAVERLEDEEGIGVGGVGLLVQLPCRFLRLR
jgi:hypothetical protein